EASVLARIVTLMREAQSSRAPIEKLADKISSIFVPSVLAISMLTFSIWMVAGGGFTQAAAAAVAVLIIACPCAMGLAGRAGEAGQKLACSSKVEKRSRSCGAWTRLFWTRPER